jgi:hypothetical protein
VPQSEQFNIAFTGLHRPILSLVGMGPGHSGVTVTDSGVRVHMGWEIDATIPRGRITSAEKATKPPIFGWGVHGWRGRWVVNGSDFGIVRLTIDPPVHARSLVFAIRPHELYISLEDPDRFLAALAR